MAKITCAKPRALQSETGKVPNWIELVPAGGVVEGRDGRIWLNDRPEVVLAAFEKDDRPLPIDCEHATERKGAIGEAAPAVGWVEELEVRDGAIWGRVDWTEDGNDLVGNRKYRFVSPVFQFDKDTLRIVRLLSVGLTNQPNLHLTALNRDSQPEVGEEDEGMKLDAALCRALGLAESATPQDALNAINKMKGDLETAENREVKPDLDKFVPRTDYDEMKTRAENAESKLQDSESTAKKDAAEKAVNQAIEEGKVAPASKGFYLSMCQEGDGLTKFQEFVKTAPKIVTEESKAPGGAPDSGGTALNSEEKAMCQALGLDEAEFAETKDGNKEGE